MTLKQNFEERSDTSLVDDELLLLSFELNTTCCRTGLADCLVRIMHFVQIAMDRSLHPDSGLIILNNEKA